MKPTFQLVIGTSNAKKRAELVRLIGGHDVRILSLADFDDVSVAEETGTTFAENARLKATHYAGELKEWVLAEDSGLCVRALDGAPGVFSARFAGENATDQDNNRLLLQKLQGTSADQRAAWYTCHIALSDPDGKIHAEAEASCNGRIIDQPRGEAGFGYDPLFEVLEYHRTFAELGDHVKAVLSHRARAWRQLLPPLTAVIETHGQSQAESGAKA